MESSRPIVVLFHLTFDLSVILTSTIAFLAILLLAYLATRNLTPNTPKKNKISEDGIF